jgi:hypothetical protein
MDLHSQYSLESPIAVVSLDPSFQSPATTFPNEGAERQLYLRLISLIYQCSMLNANNPTGYSSNIDPDP